jgi:hypothetical protein
MASPDSDGFGGGSDAGGFGPIPSSPAGDFIAEFCSLGGRFDPIEMDSDSDGFGTGSDSDGSGRIPGPHMWGSPTRSGANPWRGEHNPCGVTHRFPLLLGLRCGIMVRSGA